MHGDFDVTAQFADLQNSVDEAGAASINLQAVLPKDGGTVGCFVNRALVRWRGKDLRQLRQACFQDATTQRSGMRYPAMQADECRLGRLRITRRGNRVSFLIAESDSDRFRIYHSEEVSDEPFGLDQLRLQVGAYSNGTVGGKVDVLWKSFDVRADRIERYFQEPL